MRSHRDIPPRHLLEDQAESDERHDKAQILLDLTNVDVIAFSELPLKRLDESLPLKSVQLDIKDQKLDVHHSGMIAWCQLDGVSEWELAALAALVVSKANKAIVITYIEAAMHQSAYELHTSSFAETVEGVNALQPPAIVRGLGGSLLSKFEIAGKPAIAIALTSFVEKEALSNVDKFLSKYNLAFDYRRAKRSGVKASLAHTSMFM